MKQNDPHPDRPTPEQIQEKLWEFVYDLLPEDEAREWEERITSDPEVARAYAEVRLQSDLVADAIRVPDAHVELPRPAGHEPNVSRAERASWGTSRGAGWRKVGNLVSAAAALLLIGVIGYGQMRIVRSTASRVEPPALRRPAAPSAVRTIVYGPSRFALDINNSITVETRDPHNVPTSAKVRLQLEDTSNHVRWEAEGQTDAQGIWQVSVPAQSEPEPFVLLANVAGTERDQSAVLPVRFTRPRYVTHVDMDRAVYAPGETVFFRSVTVSRPQARSAENMDVDFSIVRQPDQAGLAGSDNLQRTTNGVAADKYELPADSREGEYTLLARNSEDAFAPTEHRFFVEHRDAGTAEIDVEFSKNSYEAGESVGLDLVARDRNANVLTGVEFQVRAGIATQLVAEHYLKANGEPERYVRFDLPPELPDGPGFVEIEARAGGRRVGRAVVPLPLQRDHVDLRFYPESGPLVADLPNRVYFEAHDASGRPLAVQGELRDARDQTVAEFATELAEKSGRGEFAFVPRADEQYHAVLTSPTNKSVAATLSAESRSFGVVLRAAERVTQAERPVTIDVSATQSGRNLVAVAACGGIEVGQIGFPSQAGTPVRVEIPVAADADGVLRVTVFDFDVTPPKAVAERLVYRQPRSKIHIDVSRPHELIAGQNARFQLHLSDEGGPVSDAIIGTSLYELGRFPDDENSSSLVADYYLLSEIHRPSDWERAAFYLSDNPEAYRSLDRLLATQGWRRIEEVTPQQLAVRFGRQFDSDDRASHAVPAGGFAKSADEIEQLGLDDAIVEPPVVVTNTAAIDETDVASPTMPTRSISSMRRWGQGLMIGALCALILSVALAYVRWASAWTWIPSAVTSMIALVMAVHWMGGWPDVTGRSHPVGSVALAPTDAEVRPDNQSDAATSENNLSADKMVPPESGAFPAESADRLNFGARSMEGGEGLGGGAAAPAPGAPLPAGGMGGGGFRAFDSPPSSKDGNMRPNERSLKMAPSSAAPLPSDSGGAFPQKPAAPEAASPLNEPTRGNMRREALALGAEHPAADKPLSSTSTAARLRGLREARLGEAGMSLENLERKVEFDRNAGDLEVLAEERGSGPSDSYQQLRIYASSLAGLMRDENLPSPPATLFWHPRLKTDNSGNAVFDVPIPQRASVYQLRAAAHAGGRLGEVRRNFEVRPAIEVQAELPAVLTQEDRVQVAFEVTNRLETALQSSWSVNQTATRNLAASPEQLAVSVPPRSQQRVETELTATGTGSSRILWRLDHHPPDVELEQTLTVLPSNYPHDRVHSDRELPAMGWDLAGETGADTATSPRMLRLRVYPSLAAEILDAAAMLDRDGATSVWTALAAQQALDWLDDHSIASTALKRKLKRLAARPQALADEPLGAYHRAWLAWEYGFNTPSTGNSLPALDSLPEPADAFEMAAAARIASLAAQPSAEERLLQLIELQTEEGYLPCRRSFAALSSPDVTLEATALAVLAWSPPANAELYSKARDKALAWLRKQRRADGSFGAADATALVLLALVRDTSRPAVASEAGHVTLNHAQRAIATTTWMARASRPAIMDAVLDSTATATRLYVEEPLPKDLPYTLLLRAWSDVPPPSKAAPLRFETRLEPHELRVGESARMQVRVEGIAIPGVVLRIAIPAGCIVDMRDLPASCRMTDHELIVRVASPFSEPRDWVRSDQVLEFAFPVIARLAGSFRSTPSKAYPLHAPEAVSWAPPVEVKIAP